MANNERLTKRVKKIEKWIEENEGGPTLDNMNYLLNITKRNADQGMQVQAEYEKYRQLCEEFLTVEELGDTWNEFLQKKEGEKNAVQKQQTEEVSVQEEAEGSEETIEAQEEEE